MRKVAYVSVNYLAKKEFLRYEMLMQIANEKTVFRWVLSDIKNASIALLDPMIFNARETLPNNCICIWIAESADYVGRKGDMIFPANFRLPDLINILDRAALRLLDKKTPHTSPDNESEYLLQRTYRISKWVSLDYDFSTPRFQKILAVMTRQAINWRWLLTYGGLTERDAYLFLEELRKKNVLVESNDAPVADEPPQQISIEHKESGLGLFVRKINQWLGRTRAQVP
jgi:hypothetical protein